MHNKCPAQKKQFVVPGVHRPRDGPGPATSLPGLRGSVGEGPFLWPPGYRFRKLTAWASRHFLTGKPMSDEDLLTKEIADQLSEEAAARFPRRRDTLSFLALSHRSDLAAEILLTRGGTFEPGERGPFDLDRTILAVGNV